MKNLVPLLVIVIALPLLLVAVVVGLLLLNTGWSPISKPVGTVLIYEVDPPIGFDHQPVDMDMLIAAIDGRVNTYRRCARIRPWGEGADRIAVGVFGNDPRVTKRIERLLAAGGTLAFRILANDRDHAELIELARGEDGDTLCDIEGNVLGWWVPVASGQEASLREYTEIATRSGIRDDRQTQEIFVVKDEFDVNGRYLIDVRPGIDYRGRPCIDFVFDATGAQLFTGLTGANLPNPTQDFTRKLGIILDGWLYSAPAIQSTISKRGQITGSFTQNEVEDLVKILSPGSLPANVRLVERLPRNAWRD